MEFSLPLDQMSTADKLRVMESLWDNLCQTPDAIPSPSWHEDVLRARRARAEHGESKFIDWNEAKGFLRQKKS